MWFSILFGLSLVALSLLLWNRHQTAWRATQGEELDEAEQTFLSRQYRRRRMANAMIAVVGLAIILGVWVTDARAAAAYWLAVLLLVSGMVVLAMADLIATRMYYGGLHRAGQEERLLLEAELKKLRRHGSNGRPDKKPLEDAE